MNYFFNKFDGKGMMILLVYMLSALGLFLYASTTGWRIMNFTNSSHWNDKQESIHYHK